jgi:hypothetical protein
MSNISSLLVVVAVVVIAEEVVVLEAIKLALSDLTSRRHTR